MNYCQDCGASNANGAKSCRICGHAMQKDLSGDACWSCQTATATGAAFCSHCGAALATADVDILVGESLPSVRGQATVKPMVVAGDGGSDIALNEGMDLPEWLKRAAAEQPFDPSQQSLMSSNPFGLAGAAPMMAAAGTATLDAEPAARPAAGSPPPTALPTAPSPVFTGPPDSLVDSGPGQIMARVEGAANGGRVAGPPVSGEELTNTATFISENDLPEWIRQIGAAEEAKRVEEARAADLAAAAATAGQSRPLPGDIVSGGPAASPWLARREAPADRDVVAADSWSRSTPPPAAPVETPGPSPVAAAAPAASPAIAETIVPFSVAEAGAASGSDNRVRMLLIAAAALAIVAVLVLFVV